MPAEPRRRRWLLRSVLLLSAVLVGGAGYTWFSSTNDCPDPGAAPADGIRAIVQCEFGGPEMLRFETIARPVPTDSQVLVRVRAASVNPADWHAMRGSPFLARFAMGWRKPANIRQGTDFAGVIEAVGAAVTLFRVGDSVFGARTGAWAEYVTVNQARLAPKPSNISFEQAAAVPVAALTALQGLRDEGRVRAGERVLVNGASGGVGTFAVQIARALGATVTGVSSGRNVELVRSIGATQALDYTQTDFTRDSARYDVIIDNVGNHSLGSLAAVLAPGGRYVMVGGPSGGIIDPFPRVLALLVRNKLGDHPMTFFIAEITKADLTVLHDLMGDGKVTPVIDRTYPYAQVREAVAYVETGRARGKVIVTLD